MSARTISNRIRKALRETDGAIDRIRDCRLALASMRVIHELDTDAPRSRDEVRALARRELSEVAGRVGDVQLYSGFDQWLHEQSEALSVIYGRDDGD